MRTLRTEVICQYSDNSFGHPLNSHLRGIESFVKDFELLKSIIFWNSESIAHGQNDNSFHRLTNSTLKNTLVLFTAK